MGLVYDINTVALPWQSNTKNWFESYANFDGVSNFQDPLTEAMQGIEQFDPGGNLVTDWIIRGQTYVNDYYIWYGSYRAYFMDLYAANTGGIAWDGFICVARAYNAVKGGRYDPDAGVPFPPNAPFAEGPFEVPFRTVYMIPMRLPYQLPPGVVGDAVKIAADSEPGVYGVNIATGLGQLYGSEVVGTDFANIDWAVMDSRRTPKLGIGVVGTQRTYTGNSTPAGISYVGFGNIFNIDYNPDSYAQGNLVDPQFQGSPAALIWAEAWGWKKESFYNNGGVGVPNLTQFVPLDDGIINMESNTTRWIFPGDVADADQANALLYSGGDGHIITKVYDLKWSADTVNLNNPKGTGIGLLCGQVAEFAGGVLQNFQPFFAGWKSVWTGDLPSYTYAKYGSTSGHPDGRPCNIKVGVASRSGTTANFIMPTDVTIDLTSGAFANTITQALPDNTVETYLNTFLVGVNYAVIGGVKQCVVYSANSPDIIYGQGFDVGIRSYCLAPLAYAGGSFVTETGLEMPSTAGGTPIWTGAVFQNQTLDLEYEERSTGKSDYQNAAALIAEGGAPTYVVDEDLVESNMKDFTIPPTEKTTLALAGVGLGNAGNCYIPGTNQETPSPTNPYANLANGLLAYQPGAGPYALIYDFGSISANLVAFSNPLQITLTGSGTQQGGEMNKDFITGSNSTTRYATCGSWDNDRDQWIFTFCDPVNGAGIMSVNSAFGLASNLQQTFLDQTVNLPSPPKNSFTPQCCIYTSRQMTTQLDGLVISGAENNLQGTDADGQVSGGRLALKGAPLAGVPAAQAFTVFGIGVITGTTGRTARVWVDYLLFDGPESLIAVELEKLGLRVTVENVEWYKAKILKAGKLGLTLEEIEDWVRMQQDEYRATLKQKERAGRMRSKRRQVAVWREGLEDTLEGDFMDKGGFETLKDLDTAAQEYVPSPSETTKNTKNTKLDSDK
jgi:hypothetical protein